MRPKSQCIQQLVSRYKTAACCVIVFFSYAMGAPTRLLGEALPIAPCNPPTRLTQKIPQ